MADPVSLMVISGIAAGGVQAFGSIFSGEAEKNMATYRAGVAQANQKIFQQNAAVASDVGERQAYVSGLRTAQEVGQQRAGAGAGNLAPSVGSPSQVRTSQIEAGRITGQNIRYSAAQSAFGEEVKAFGAGATAGLEKTGADTAMPAAEIGAVGSVLGAASSVAGKWAQAKQTGVPSFSWSG